MACRCGCPDCAEKIAWLEGELGLVVSASLQTKIKQCIGLRPSASRIVAALYLARGKVLSKALLNDAAGGAAGTEDRNIKIVDVWVHYARAAGCAIGTSWGVGYYAEPALIRRLDLAVLPLSEAA